MKPYLEPILFRLRLQKIKKYIPQNSKICDICCGVNGNLLLKMKHFIAEGIGYDKEVNAKKAGNISLKKNEILNQIAEKSDYFDCVTLLAALEHLTRPEEILKESFRILKPGGIILITTPDSGSRWLLEFLSFRLGIVSPEQIKDHKYYFDREKLFKLLVSAGFKKERIIIEKFEFGCNLFARAAK